jgi:hypothetical protein
MSNFLLEPGPYVTAGTIMGFVGGWLFYLLWRGLLPRSRSREFWRSLPDSVHGMLTSDEPSDLFRHYRTLVVAAARYAGRNTLAVLVGTMPIAVIFLLLNTLDLSSRVATSVEVYPATAIVRPAGLMSDWRMDDERLLIDLGKSGDLSVQLAGQTLDRESLAKKQAFCETTISCLLFDMMLFETHSIDPQAESQRDGSVVVRPVLLDSNPFWPYLNDLDFWFFIAVMSGSAAAAWWSRHRRVTES